MSHFYIFRFISYFVFVSANEKKVPPRTPPQRLNTLKRFADTWISAEIEIGLNRPARATKMLERIQLMNDKLILNYNKCGFFDPTLPHGGPKPIARKRRSDEVDVFDHYEEGLISRSMALGDIRLSNDAKLAWKQIGTGYRKWIHRYMTGCSGERIYNYHSNRLNTV